MDAFFEVSRVVDKKEQGEDGTEHVEGSCELLEPSGEEVRKTWSFRSSTIAQRSVPVQSDRSMPVRRSSRRIKRTEKLLEFLSAAKQGRTRRGQTHVHSENYGSPHQDDTGADKAVKAHLHKTGEVELSDERSTLTPALAKVTGRKRTAKCSLAGGYASSDTEDSDDITLKELQDILRKRRRAEEQERAEGSLATRHAPRGGAEEVAQDEQGMRLKAEGRPSTQRLESEEEDTDEGTEEGESDQSDDNAIYCICRQKHNRRFMICCDRCEEWFHGDCVGITEAYGRQLERNGEDYICPNCTWGKTEPAFESASCYGTQMSSVENLTSGQMACSADTGDISSGDSGIEKRLETTVCVAEDIEISQPSTVVTGLSRCIGPGCDQHALPDSVYCSSGCIVRHAAATMQSLSNLREPKQRHKANIKVQRKLTHRNALRSQGRPVQQRRVTDRETESWSHREEAREAPSYAEEWAEQELSTSDWFTDHNFNTVEADKMAAVTAAVDLSVSAEKHMEVECQMAAFAEHKEPTVTSASPLGVGKPVAWESAPENGAASHAGGVTVSQSRISSVPSLSRTPSADPKRPSHLLCSHCPQLMSSRATLVSALVSVAATPTGCLTSPLPPGNSQAHGLNPIRQNICHSLTDVLCKRVSEICDLDISEGEIENLAVEIEKEIFNMFHNTDIQYKNKYRTIVFCLKCPKNKALFLRVIKREVTPFKLVRMNPDQFLCKETCGSGCEEVSPTHKAQFESLGQEVELDMKAEEALCEHKEQSPSVLSDEGSLLSSPSDLFCSMPSGTDRLQSRILTDQVPPDEELLPKKLMLTFTTGVLKVAPEEKQDSSYSKAEVPVGPTVEEVPLAPRQKFPLDIGRGCDLPTVSPSSSSSSKGSNTSTKILRINTNPGMPFVTDPSQDLRSAVSPPTLACTYTTVPMSETGSIQVLTAPSAHSKTVPLNPASSHSSISVVELLPPEDFLSNQQLLWKGYINMHTVAKLAAKARLVFGSVKYLEEDLPCTIQISGRVCPSTVWEYLGKVKTSLSKEVCLLRFYPASEEEEDAYVLLFSYFNSRGRFGVVATNNQNIKDLYVIPLSAKGPIPSTLLPFEGPGLESNRPNLLLGLVICQKQRCAAVPSESEDKRLYAKSTALRGQCVPPRADDIPGRAQLCHPKKHHCTGSTSPPSISALLSHVTPSAAPGACAHRASGASSSSSDPCSPRDAAASSRSPLETILMTLFGKQKGAATSGKLSAEPTRPRTLLFDPIVQKFGHNYKKEEEDAADDIGGAREPHEEFDLGVGCSSGKTQDSVSVLADNEAADTSAVDYRAFDTEDGCNFKEPRAIDSRRSARMRPAASADKRTTSGSDTSVLTNQQRILEELNKEIELQKQELEEQEEALRLQRLAIGMSMARFSVSDALMSPPSKSLQLKEEFLHLDQKVEDLLSVHSATTVITQSPKQNEDGWPEASNQWLQYQSLQNEKTCTRDSAQGEASEQLDFSYMRGTNVDVYQPQNASPHQPDAYAALIREKGHCEMESDFLQNHVTETLEGDKNCRGTCNQFSNHKSIVTKCCFQSPVPNPIQKTSTTNYMHGNNTPSSEVSRITGVHLAGEESSLTLPMETENPDCDNPQDTSPSTPFQTQFNSPSICDINQNHFGHSQQQVDSPQSISYKSKVEQEGFMFSLPVCQKGCHQKMNQLSLNRPVSNVNYSTPRSVSFNPPATHVPDPRAASPPSYAVQRPRKPLLDTPRGFPKFHYNNGDNCHQGMAQHEVQPSSHYRVGRYSSSRHDLFPLEREQPRGLPGDRFTPLNRSPRLLATSLHSQEVHPTPHREPFQDYRRWQSSEYQFQSDPSPLKSRRPQSQADNQFSHARRQSQLNFQGQILSEGRPLKHSGPLLPTPPEYLVLFDNSRRQSSDTYYQDLWHHTPDMGRRSDTYHTHEPRCDGTRTRRFQSGHEDRESVQWKEDLRRGGSVDYGKSGKTGEKCDKSASRERYMDRGGRGPEDLRDDADLNVEKDLVRNHRQRSRDRDQHSKASDEDKAKRHNGDHSRDRYRHHERDYKQERWNARNDPLRRDRGRRKDLGKHPNKDMEKVQDSLDREWQEV